MNLAAAILWLTSIFLPSAIPQGLATARGATSIVEVCAVAGMASCTPGANVATGSALVVIPTNEVISTLTVSDPCSDTFTASAESPINSSGNGTVYFYSTVTTCPISNGTGTIAVSGASLTVLGVYAISPSAASSINDVHVSNTFSSTSWSMGPTSNTTAADVCIGAGLVYNGTFSSSGIFTLLTGSNQSADTRYVGFEYAAVMTATPVTFTFTTTTTNGGAFLGQCIKT